MEPTDIAISTDSIKLGQFVKLANFVATGGEAKLAITEGVFAVNGETETRRGRTLHDGDVVSHGGAQARVVVGADDDDDFFDEATADDDFDPEKWRNL